MVLMLFVLLLLPYEGMSLTYLTPPQMPGFPPTEGVYTPTLLSRMQWSGGEKTSGWGKNFSVFMPLNDPNACAGSYSAADASGKIVYGVWFPASCYDVTSRAIFADSVGAVGFWMGAVIPQKFAMFTYGSSIPPGNIPAFYSDNLLTDQLLSNQIPISLGPIGAFFSGMNVSVRMDYPELNPMFYALINWPSGPSCLYWINFALSLFVCMFVSAKWAIFFQHESNKFSLSLILLSLAWVGSCFNIYLSLAGIGGFWLMVSGNEAVTEFFGVWNYGFAFSCVTVLGFFFAELGHLTSARTVVGLDLMKWPALAVNVVVWMMIIIAGFLFIYYAQSLGAFGVSNNLMFSALIIGLGVATIIVSYGGVRLVLQASQNTVIIRTMIVTGIIVVSMDLFGVLYGIDRYLFVSLAPGTADNWVVELFHIWGPSIVFLGVAFILRVSVSQEIEISKSGTSSTSGASSKSFSQTSSSSTADPVVEL